MSAVPLFDSSIDPVVFVGGGSALFGWLTKMCCLQFAGPEWSYCVLSLLLLFLPMAEEVFIWYLVFLYT